jgi:hypothetical protein
VTAPRSATLLAVQEFHDFARCWVPPGVREQLWDPRNNPVTRIVKAIKAIAPPSEPVGYGVFTRAYAPENKSRIEYVQVGLIFESPVQADHLHRSCLKRQPGDDFVICELQEHR